MGNYAFNKDLAEAKPWEEKVAKWLEARGNEIVGFNNNNRHDIMYKNNGNAFTMEVKHDILSKKTGNVAIEFKSWGHPSGICTSKADYWCQIVNDEDFYIIERPTLIYNMLKGKYPVKSGGDDYKTYMYILSIPTFAQMCVVHKGEKL